MRYLFLALLLGCSQPPATLLGVSEEDGQPDTALAYQREPWQAVDSLSRLPACVMTWRADLGDSLRVCSDPRPPGPL